MIKKFTFNLLFLILLTNNSSVFASNTQYIEATNINGTNICMMEDVMKELVKQSLYNIGNKAITKYLGPDSNFLNNLMKPKSDYTYTPTNNYSNVNTSVPTSSQQQTVTPTATTPVVPTSVVQPVVVSPSTTTTVSTPEPVVTSTPTTTESSDEGELLVPLS